MQIRKAVMNDIEAVLMMARQFVNAAQAPGLKYDAASIVGLVFMLTTQDNARMFVAEDKDGEVIGMVGGVLVPSQFDQQRLEAVELFWWVDPGYRKTGAGEKLLEEFERAAKDGGAKAVKVSSLQNCDQEAVEQFYAARGYHAAERYFGKEI